MSLSITKYRPNHGLKIYRKNTKEEMLIMLEAVTMGTFIYCCGTLVSRWSLRINWFLAILCGMLPASIYVALTAMLTRL